MGESKNKIEAGRADYAYICAEDGVKSNSKEYKSYVKNIPMLIKTNGLAATFAFMFSKGGTYKTIYEQVEKWLKDKECIIKDIFTKQEYSEAKTMIKKLTLMNSSDYKVITNEVMALFTWLRRFAEGLAKE
ncbi:MAG: type III-B CRISPR module-associated protein Cmr5 [Caldisericia bacterium]|nr:type III-B CRISPR module-associated protein Cmr5 [Caldisericia bacterium]